MNMRLWFVVVLATLAKCFGRLDSVGRTPRALLDEVSQRYEVGDLIQLWGNKVGPFSNPSETYEYYKLPFCRPPEGIKFKTLTHVGEVIDANRDASTPFEVPFNVVKDSTILCTQTLRAADAAAFRKAIQADYFFQMYFDSLPIWGFIGTVEKILTPGMTEFRTALFTHAHFDVHFNGDRVIEIALQPRNEEDPAVDISEAAIAAAPDNSLPVEFTYSVSWHETRRPFAQRLDHYEQHRHDPIHLEIHWFSIINSALSVLLLTAILVTIFMRVLKHDFAKFSDEAADEDEAGWKFIHGDVFRFPDHPNVFSALVGAGTQLLYLTLCVFALALVGVFYPYNRGLLYTAQITLYAVTSGVAGFTSATLYRQLRGTAWVRNVGLTATAFAAPFFAVFCVVNTVAIAYRSMAALPAGTIAVIIIIWLLVTVPLTTFMAIAGKNGAPEFDAPCRTNKYARVIPELPWYRDTPAQMLLAGFLPFSAIYVELYYVFASVWGHKVFFLWNILAIVFVILLTATAFVTVALTYFQLAAEDHRWWWRSFLCGGSTGILVFVYAMYYYVYKSDMSGLLQGAFFFGYMGLACYGLFLMLGAVGFKASLFFVKSIYRAIKCD